jgi:hypothetical protein
MMTELEKISLLNEAAAVIVKAHDEFIVIADKYKENPQSQEAENAYCAMLDRINPTVLAWADAESRVTGEMATAEEYINHAQMKAIRNIVLGKVMELHRRIPVFPQDT